MLPCVAARAMDTEVWLRGGLMALYLAEFLARVLRPPCSPFRDQGRVTTKHPWRAPGHT